MTYIAKQEFLQFQPGDEVPTEEVEFNDWVQKDLVELSKPVASPTKKAAKKAATERGTSKKVKD